MTSTWSRPALLGLFNPSNRRRPFVPARRAALPEPSSATRQANATECIFKDCGTLVEPRGIEPLTS